VFTGSEFRAQGSGLVEINEKKVTLNSYKVRLLIYRFSGILHNSLKVVYTFKGKIHQKI
jgi:hypothetical protein